tara:strand:+ start:126 stop:644 length:519 start_codon:yes stop_codon:yes gene_type:complete
MGGLFSFFRRPRDIRALMVGLDAAGKTSILYKMHLGESILTMPTLGFNVETLHFNNVKMQVWDIGGQDKLRRLWKHYFHGANALVFVVDSNDNNRINIAKNELHKLLSFKELENVIVLVLANKQDLPKAMNIETIIEKMELNELKNKWYCQGTCATKGDGLTEGFNWITNNI